MPYWRRYLFYVFLLLWIPVDNVALSTLLAPLAEGILSECVHGPGLFGSRVGFHATLLPASYQHGSVVPGELRNTPVGCDSSAP